METAASTLASEMLGPFRVSADPALVARFANVVGATLERVPATFPMTWLALPEIRAAILRRVHAGEVAFHEDQSFQYRGEIETGADYELTATVERRDDPARVAIASAVRRADAPVLDMLTLMRIIARPEAGALQLGASQQ